MAGEKKRLHYDCTKCIAFCCSIYERVEVSDFDIKRLANHFGVSVAIAKEKYTTMRDGSRVLKRTKDPLFGKSCKFLHPETRGCTIYEARPKTCREYPGRTRCAYYDALRFERTIQDDPTIIPIVRLMFRKT
ncbi:MAG: YkgJ family cysteine cluster protein [Polyangiaceae bacterium]|nr:YkgJ family cysteine cluster protein [Polyangiaceae bacterium]